MDAAVVVAPLVGNATQIVPTRAEVGRHVMRALARAERAVCSVGILLAISPAASTTRQSGGMSASGRSGGTVGGQWEPNEWRQRERRWGGM